MALWTPTEISTALWLDAADSSTITIATGVSEWRDKSGNGRNATQGTANYQPALAAASLNGLSTVSFDGVNDALNMSVPQSSPSTVFAVLKTTSLQTGDRVFLNRTTTSAPYPPAFYLSNGNNNNPGIYWGSAWALSVSTPYRTSYLAAFRLGPGTASFRADGGTEQIATTNESVLSTWNVIGSSSVQQAIFNCAEIIICNGVVSDSTRTKIEGYLAWKWGLQGRLPVGHPYKNAAPIIVIMAVCSQLYDLLPLQILRGVLDQPYFITTKILAAIDQLYGLQLLAVLSQHYGDVPVVRQLLDQYYGSAYLLRRLCAQPYGDALMLRAVVDQEWIMPGYLQAIMEQRYSLSAGELRAMAVQQYDINENMLLRMMLEQVYVMSPRESLVQRPVIEVAADGIIINPHHVNIEAHEGEYAIKGEIHLSDQAEFLACKHLETWVVITIDADEYHLLVESPRRSRPEMGQTDYYVPLVSPTVLLDAPYATPISREFAGAMASAIVAELAATAEVAVQWDMVDWYIPAGTLYANTETPMAVIAKIVAAAGGVRQTSPAGALICRPEYPAPVNTWETAVPAMYLTDMDNFFSVDSSPEIRDGYNKFLIGSQDAAQGGITLEVVDVSASAKKIEVYQVPFIATDRIALKTSGGSWVTIANNGIKTETITDLVEIVGGEGKTKKPFYGLVIIPEAAPATAYKLADLGEINITEDGRVTTEISGNTLLEIEYITKYRQFVVRSPQIEDVQFFPEVTA